MGLHESFFKSVSFHLAIKIQDSRPAIAGNLFSLPSLIYIGKIIWRYHGAQPIHRAGVQYGATGTLF